MDDMKCPLCGTPHKKKEFVKEKIKELKEFNEKAKTIKKASDIGVSHHAIDRMSTRHAHTYLKYRKNGDEGIATWMRNVGLEMLDSGQISGLQAIVKCYGVKWLFQKSKKSLVYRLMTVTPINRDKDKKKVRLWRD